MVNSEKGSVPVADSALWLKTEINLPKVSTSKDLPLSHECKRVLAYGTQESERLNHKHIGTEHLLLGLLLEEKCFAAEILHERGLKLSTIREQLSTTIHCKTCGALNPTGVCGNSRLEWHERIAELETALERAEHILGDELEEGSQDDTRNYRRIDDALQVIRKVLPRKGEKRL